LIETLTTGGFTFKKKKIISSLDVIDFFLLADFFPFLCFLNGKKKAAH